MTILVLVGLFSVQRIGTGSVGRMFGWVMVLWFATHCRARDKPNLAHAGSLLAPSTRFTPGNILQPTD